ncbi:MAG: YdcF family protein [Blastocatellia bacterium]
MKSFSMPASRHARRALLLTAILLFLWLLTPPLLNAISHALIRRDPAGQADVIIALSGDPDGLRERYAADLYHQGVARRMIVGGVPYPAGVNGAEVHTGDTAKAYLVRLGVAADDIHIIREAWNTRVEAGQMAEIMRGNGWRSVIVVTDMFHSRRAALTVRRAAPDFKVYSMPLPPGRSRWNPDRWWTRRGDMWLTVRESLAWINTLAGGLR